MSAFWKPFYKDFTWKRPGKIELSANQRYPRFRLSVNWKCISLSRGKILSEEFVAFRTFRNCCKFFPDQFFELVTFHLLIFKKVFLPHMAVFAIDFKFPESLPIIKLCLLAYILNAVSKHYHIIMS